MNDNIEQLRELKEHLEHGEREFSAILAKEPLIARPLHQAADEARRIYKSVTEAHAP